MVSFGATSVSHDYAGIDDEHVENWVFCRWQMHTRKKKKRLGLGFRVVIYTEERTLDNREAD